MNTRRVVVAFIVVIAAAVSAVYAVRRSREGQARAVREALFDELKTVTLKNCTLKRYGSAHDGGYLMCENLMDGVQSAYSYGIDSEDNWGCDVSTQLNIAVHQYDCFTSHR